MTQLHKEMGEIKKNKIIIATETNWKATQENDDTELSRF